MNEDKNKEKRLFTFRVKYNYGDYISAEDSYHYYSTYSAEQALDNHCISMEKKTASMPSYLSGEAMSLVRQVDKRRNS